MSCNCGKPKCGGKCGISPAVLQINNSDCTIFHKTTIPASMGDETTIPPIPGKYKNELVFYEASKASYLYSSDGIPTLISADPDSLPLATTSTPGAVIVGYGLNVSGAGVISLDGDAVHVDDALSTTSENPVQNKVITSTLNTKADTSAIPTATSDLVNDSGFLTSVPVATDSTLGGVVVGTGLTIDANGVLAATGLTSVGWDEIQNKPNFATVATSGDYDDLTDKPALSAVATSGAYSDLTGTPILATVASTGDYDDLIDKPNLATVATTGNYSDLSGQPNIPIITLTDVDPGEGVALADGTFIGVYQ